jgi:NSS family neurotransmitter:Na+ symporter
MSTESQPPRPRENWGTRIGVVLAVAGSAVGLGNFLRFPGEAASNGGGVFMIPYFISLVLLGLPLAWAEWGMGRYGGRCGYNSAPAIFGALGGHRAWRYAGGLALLIPIIIYMYYVLIEAWCLGYAWQYLWYGGLNLSDGAEGMVQSSKNFFGNFTGANADGMMVQGGLQQSVIFWLIVFSINFIIIFNGVTKGIERFCIVAMPLMAVAAIIVLFRVMTLPPIEEAGETRTVMEGLGYMWNPKPMDAESGESAWMALLNADVWLAAAGQIFFSLSVGFGIIVNYASYLRRNDDVALSGLTAASTNAFFEVCLGGLITIPAAFLFLGLLRMQEAGISTFGLGFTTLPIVFETMHAGRIFGFVWFFMLFLAAITSSVSMLQPAIAFLEEGLNIGRRASVALLGMITALGSGFVIFFSKDLAALDTLDFWVGTALIFVLATIQAVLFAWIFGVKTAYQELTRGAAMQVPGIWRFVIRYISPTFLLIVFVFWAWQKFPGYVEQLSEGGTPLLAVGLIGIVLVFLMILISIASSRWGDPRQLKPLEEDAA